MARSLEIAFPDSSGVHRVRNFAEELSLSLGALGELPMEQADAATNRLVISKIAKRDVGRCKQLVARLLEKHFMINEAVVNEMRGDPA